MDMNDGEMLGKVNSSMYHQCQKRGYATPVDAMMDIGILPKQQYENWRFGKITYTPIELHLCRFCIADAAYGC